MCFLISNYDVIETETSILEHFAYDGGHRVGTHECLVEAISSKLWAGQSGSVFPRLFLTDPTVGSRGLIGLLPLDWHHGRFLIIVKVG